jgi:hypothetical protein
VLTDTAKQNSKSRESRIRLRAEELYRLRGNRRGSALDDWLLAEKQIRQEEERAIDEALEASFPASDPPAR